MVELPPLPIPKTPSAAYSQETLEYHYGKHHQAYVTNLNKLVPGTEFENASLEEIVRKASGGIFNNGAQVWNHTFYWNCLSPKGGGKPSGELAQAIDKAFGSFDAFKEKSPRPRSRPCSGWAWLVRRRTTLAVVSTATRQSPERRDTPILTCDVGNTPTTSITAMPAQIRGIFGTWSTGTSRRRISKAIPVRSEHSKRQARAILPSGVFNFLNRPS